MVRHDCLRFEKAGIPASIGTCATKTRKCLFSGSEGEKIQECKAHVLLLLQTEKASKVYPDKGKLNNSQGIGCMKL